MGRDTQLLASVNTLLSSKQQRLFSIHRQQGHGADEITEGILWNVLILVPGGGQKFDIVTQLLL